MTSERLNPVKRLNLERIIFITFYPFQSLSSLMGISGLVLRLYILYALFFSLLCLMQFLSSCTQSQWKTKCILGTINFHLNDGTSYCTATLHAVMPFNISKLITVAILKSDDSCAALFLTLLRLSVCICMLNKVKTSTTKQ